MTTQEEQRVKVLLRAVEPPAPKVDIADAMRSGDRTKVTRRVSALALGVVAVAVAAVAVQVVATDAGSSGGGAGREIGAERKAAPPAAACTVATLAKPDGRGAFATGIDPTGRYVIGEADGDNGSAPVVVLWTDGRPQVLSAEATGAEDVNAAGVVVGSALSGGGGYAWVYRNGKVTRLPVPAGGAATAVAVNTRGDIAGELHKDGKTVPIVWPAGNVNGYRTLTSPGPARVRDLTDDGTVVGGIEGGVPYRWAPDGTGSELPTLPGLGGGWVVEAAGEWAVGFLEAEEVRASPSAGQTAPPPSSSMAGVRWNLTTGKVTAVGGSALPEAVNTAGLVVFPENPPRVVGLDGAVRTLPTVDGRPLAAAKGISDNGVVAGSAQINHKTAPPNDNTPTVALLWRC